MADMNNGFGNRQNRNNDIQITTNTISMFDDSSVQLRVAGFQDSIQLAWWIPVRAETGRNTYPPDHRFSAIMSPDRVVALDNIIRTVILPAYQRGESVTRGVFTTRSNIHMIQIEITSDGNIYAYFHKDIDENHRPRESFRFHFTSIPIITRYNKDTGDYDSEQFLSTFYMFANTIHAFAVQGVSGASAHADRYFNRYNTSRTMKYLTEIALKVGVNLEGAGLRAGLNNNPQANSSGYSNNSFPATQTPLREVDDFSSMIF